VSMPPKITAASKPIVRRATIRWPMRSRCRASGSRRRRSSGSSRTAVI
jgi:hypothetical protein